MLNKWHALRSWSSLIVVHMLVSAKFLKKHEKSSKWKTERKSFKFLLYFPNFWHFIFFFLCPPRINASRISMLRVIFFMTISTWPSIFELQMLLWLKSTGCPFAIQTPTRNHWLLLFLIPLHGGPSAFEHPSEYYDEKNYCTTIQSCIDHHHVYYLKIKVISASQKLSSFSLN